MKDIFQTKGLSILIAVPAIVLVVSMIMTGTEWELESAAAIAFSLLAAFALLRAHKTSWLVAIIALIVAGGLQMLLVFDADDTTGGAVLILRSFLLAAIGLGLFLVFTRARYPYLDRRQGWVGAPAERFELRTPVVLRSHKDFDGVTESLSSSGCRVRIQAAPGQGLGQRFVEIQFKDLPGVLIRAQQVGIDSTVVRLKFKEFLQGERSDFETWLSRLSAQQTSGPKS